MTYETKWKDEIKKQYDKLRRTWKPKQPGEKFTVTRFGFMNDFMRTKYNELSPEEKEEVEEYRNKQADPETMSSDEKQQQ